MPSVFTRIVQGQLPGHFIWADEICFGLLSINPITPGHSLVIPRAEVDHWLDLDPAQASHLMTVAHHVGSAINDLWSPARVGLMIAGFEVPHTHLHVIAINTMADMSFENAASAVADGELAEGARNIRSALGAAGFAEFAPSP